MLDKTQLNIQKFGSLCVDFFHYAALFLIGGTVAWSAGAEFLHIFTKGQAELKDILLMFIYLELGAMIGIYFRTHRLPVQFLIFIAITALSRHLVVDVQMVTHQFHLYLLLSISFAIVLLSLALYVLSSTAKRFGRPEDNLQLYDEDVPSKNRIRINNQEYHNSSMQQEVADE